MSKQHKANEYWNLKEGDTLLGKKIVTILFLDDTYDGNHLKLLEVEDGTEYFLDNAGLRKVEPPKP